MKSIFAQIGPILTLSAPFRWFQPRPVAERVLAKAEDLKGLSGPSSKSSLHSSFFTALLGTKKVRPPGGAGRPETPMASSQITQRKVERLSRLRAEREQKSTEKRLTQQIHTVRTRLITVGTKFI